MQAAVLGGAVAVVCGALALHSIRWAPYHPVLRARRLGVPPTWPELEILHLSDLHLRRSDPDLVKAQKRSLTRLPRQPDVVCVTGDLCEKVEDAPLVAEVLECLRPKFGMYLIPGNHEYNAGSPKRYGRREGLVSRLLDVLYRPTLSEGLAEGAAIVEAVRGLGLHVLRNEGIRLQVRERTLWLAGVDSGWAGLADVARAMSGRARDEGTLVLVHEPELVFPAIDERADVVLAGHTHGGQVCLPVVGPPFWHQMDDRLKVAAGVQVIGSTQLHITAGMGQLMPLRFRCPTEMVWLRCVPSLSPAESGMPYQERAYSHA